MQSIQFSQAQIEDIEPIWEILQAAIQRRKEMGSTQWQDGYPNLEQVNEDIAKGRGYVFKNQNKIVAYAAFIMNDEPAYSNIVGQWLSEDDFLVIHRVAVSSAELGKGYGRRLLLKAEEVALKNNIRSIKIDTNFDNYAMLHILEQLDYTFCGLVYLRGQERQAFEKILRQKAEKNKTIDLILGGNQGDRMAYLKKGLLLIEEEIGTIVLKSPVYETASWGREELGPHLNIAVAVNTSKTAEQVLQLIHKIEAACGRQRNDHWGNRTLDIDILFYDDAIITTEDLIIPHPRISERRFVLQPLADIAPDKVHPVLQQTVQELLANCTDSLSVNLYLTKL